jgi:hypothetical protein
MVRRWRGERGEFFVPCPECKGAGEVRLPEHLKRVMSLFAPGKKLTVAEAQAALLLTHRERIEHTALCQRMNALSALGLLKRERRSGNAPYFYSKTGEQD